MKILFVRHGATMGNRRHCFQSDQESLSSQGIMQARRVRHEVHEAEPTHLITSNLSRARETAGIIAADQALPVETNILFREVDRPPHLAGKRYLHPRAIWYMLAWLFWSGESYWERVDGESLRQFNLRLEEAKQYLESFKSDDTIAIVSHSCFIPYFATHAKRNRRIGTVSALFILLRTRLLKNASISTLTYDHEAGKWQQSKSSA